MKEKLQRALDSLSRVTYATEKDVHHIRAAIALLRELKDKLEAAEKDAARWNFATSSADWAVCRYAGRIGFVDKWEPIMNYIELDAAMKKETP